MLTVQRDSKLCFLCGKDLTLEHFTIDDNGSPVHKSCQEKQRLLSAAAIQAEQWRQSHRKHDVA